MFLFCRVYHCSLCLAPTKICLYFSFFSFLYSDFLVSPWLRWLCSVDRLQEDLSRRYGRSVSPCDISLSTHCFVLLCTDICFKSRPGALGLAFIIMACLLSPSSYTCLSFYWTCLYFHMNLTSFALVADMCVCATLFYICVCFLYVRGPTHCETHFTITYRAGCVWGSDKAFLSFTPTPLNEGPTQ